MSKRSRTESGMYSRQNAAAAINAAVNRRYPYADYGRVMHKRGTSSGMAKYGGSYASASADQRQMRKSDGYYGRGMYSGRGMYGGGGSNELMSGSSNSSPKFESVGDESGSLIVAHREYIGDIFAPPSATVSEFSVQAFPINPGLEQSFPWLSQIAQNYEEYELIQCVYEFVSTVQDVNSTNGQVGTIITATNYNSSRPDFTDKPQMAAYAHSVSGKTTDNQTSGVECDPSKLSGSEGKYIRANPVLTGEDLKTYDHGKFQLATHNIPSSMASGTLGELYCAYKIKLRKPKFFTGRGLGITRALFLGSTADTQNDHILGTDANMLTGMQNNLAVKVVQTANSLAITFPAYYGGRVTVMLRAEGSGGNLTGTLRTSTALAGNVSFVKDLFGTDSAPDGTPNYEYNVLSGGSAVYQASLDIEPSTNATDNVFTITTGITCSDALLGQTVLEISEYNTFQQAGAAQFVNPQGVRVTPS